MTHWTKIRRTNIPKSFGNSGTLLLTTIESQLVTGVPSNVATTLLPFRDLAVSVDNIGPAWLRRKLFVDWSPSKYVRQMRDIVDMMDKTSKEVIDNKKQALAKGDGEVLNQIGQGKDIMSILRTFSMQLAIPTSKTDLFSL